MIQCVSHTLHAQSVHERAVDYGASSPASPRSRSPSFGFFLRHARYPDRRAASPLRASLCVSVSCVSVSLPPSRPGSFVCVCHGQTEARQGERWCFSRLGFAPLITPGRADGWDTRARPEFAMQIHEESIYSMLVFHGMSNTMYWSLEGIFP